LQAVDFTETKEMIPDAIKKINLSKKVANHWLHLTAGRRAKFKIWSRF
jgi:hypothetical protein